MERSGRLAQLLRERKPLILQHWERAVRATPVARDLGMAELIDTMPELLDQLAQVAEEGSKGGVSTTLELSSIVHAQERLHLGYSISELAIEYVALRQALYEVLQDAWSEIAVIEWRCVSAAVDQAIATVVDKFSRARDAKLRALERMSNDSFTASSLDALLTHLLGILVDAVPAVDTVTILLREGDLLRVRASKGLEGEIQRGFSIALGEGFAGTIAATRKPLLLHDAKCDPLVKSDDVRAQKIRALYGVPLLTANELVGVAHMGSRTAFDFATEDMILFGGLANRATALITSQQSIDALRLQSDIRERFLGILGHDLRTPLQAVVGSAQLLLTHGDLSELQRRAVTRIGRSAERITRLTNDVLDFARTRLGSGIPITVEWIDIGEVCRHVVDEFDVARPSRSIRLVGAIRGRVQCDGDRVAQALSNLVSNAVEYSSPDTPIEVRLAERDDQVTIAVHNDGEPIPPEELPELFEPFRRGKQQGGGTGLGLFIARGIAIAHRGSIEARSSHEEGTTFTIKLPRAQPAPPSHP